MKYYKQMYYRFIFFIFFISLKIICQEYEIKSVNVEINKNSNKKGKNNIRHLYSWTKDNKIIKCYGWYDGNHDCVNKHELIPYGSSKFLEEDSSEKLLLI